MSVAAIVLALLIGGNVHASTTNSKEYTPKKLVIAFDPSSNAETMESKAQPFGKLLSKQLGIPVKVVVATNDDTMIEGMGSGKVDCAFLPPEGYVLAHQKYGVKVILQSTRYAYKEPDDQMTHHLVKDFHAQILVRKGSGIKSLKDLRGKKIAVQSSTSTAGWIWPVVALYKHGINIYKDHIQTVQVKGHDQGVMAVYNGSALPRCSEYREEGCSGCYAKGCSALYNAGNSRRYGFSSREYESCIPKETDQCFPNGC